MSYLATVPLSQISQSLLHQPDIWDQGEIGWNKDCGIFLFTFFAHTAQTYNLQLLPSWLLSLVQFLCAEGLTHTSAKWPWDKDSEKLSNMCKAIPGYASVWLEE